MYIFFGLPFSAYFTIYILHWGERIYMFVHFYCMSTAKGLESQGLHIIKKHILSNSQKQLHENLEKLLKNFYAVCKLFVSIV